jgi:hypothetical protein
MKDNGWADLFVGSRVTGISTPLLMDIFNIDSKEVRNSLHFEALKKF